MPSIDRTPLRTIMNNGFKQILKSKWIERKQKFNFMEVSVFFKELINWHKNREQKKRPSVAPIILCYIVYTFSVD